MTIPFAALSALLAALIETTVLPEIPIAGATADLVLTVAIVATLVFGIEDGLIAAFLGGLFVDMLIPGRPLGAATVALLLVTGTAALVARLIGPNRRWAAVVLTILLTAAYHVLLALLLVLTENAPLDIQFTTVLVSAFMNGIVAFLLTPLFGAIEHRFGSVDRVDW